MELLYSIDHFALKKERKKKVLLDYPHQSKSYCHTKRLNTNSDD